MGQWCGQRAKMIGWAYSHKRITTRKNRQQMEFIAMEDLTGRFEVTVFPRVYERHAPILRGNGPYLVHGLIEEHHGVFSMTADRIELIETETVFNPDAREVSVSGAPMQHEEPREALQYGSGRRSGKQAS